MSPYDLAAIFTEIELHIIKSLKRTFFKHKEDEIKEGFQWEQWQLTKLRNMQKYRQENKAILEEHSHAIEQAIQEELSNAYKEGYGNTEKVIRKARKISPTIVFPEDINPVPIENKKPESGLSPLSDVLPKVTPKKENENLPVATTGDNFFGMNDKKLKALTDSVKKDFRNAEAALLRQADDVFRQTIFKTHMYLQSGATSLNQAIDMATKDFLEKGLNCIVYKNGVKVNIASYAEMALRTASQRATFMGEGQKRNERGIHLVVVSAHANTCKLCLPWQGKVLIDDVYSNPSQEYIQEYSKKYKLLSEAMKAGLLHPNCRHTLATYFEGITKIPEPVDDKEALKNYEAEQRQRNIERQIRKWKRIEAGSVDAKNVNAAADKLKEWQNQLRQHLKDNPQLRRDYTREQNKIPVEKSGNNDILSNKKWLKAPFSTQKKFEKHIEKHLNEYGNISPEQYLNTARDLLAAPLSDDIEGFMSKLGFVFKYRKSTNDFTIGRADGKISTLYKPIDGYEDWLQQIKDYKEG